jgi:quercetin dioxygenase-like cupin family protein
VIHDDGARSRPIPPSHAAGQAFSNRLDNSLAKELRLNIVRFEPGGKSHWHVHQFEQGLVITEGRGVVATEAGEQIVQAGDVVVIEAEEKHWHGATEESGMVHVVIDGVGDTTILEPVESGRVRE